MAKKKVQKPVVRVATEVVKGDLPSLVSVKNVTAQKVPFHYKIGKKRIYVDLLPMQVVSLPDTHEVRQSLAKFKNSLFIV